MSAFASGTAMQLAILFMLIIMGGRSAAMDESASSLSGSSSSVSSGQSDNAAPALVGSMPGPRYSPLVDSRIPLIGGKRAFTYRAEYIKRLPLYQFGLGKRWAQDTEDKRSHRYSFGVGKRSKGYSFGLGKRNSLNEMDIARLSYAGYLPREFYDAYAQSDAQGKRSGRFNFGLGKRGVDFTGEGDDGSLHEKLPVKHLRDKYSFGLGKRFYDEEANDDEEEEEELSWIPTVPSSF